MPSTEPPPAELSAPESAPGPPAPASSLARGSSLSPTALGLWLLVALVAAKAVHFGLPGGEYGVTAWLRDIVVASAADAAFAAGFAVIAAVLLRATRRWPAAQRRMGYGLLAIAAFGAVYAVASVQIFDFLRSPLTYPLLYMAGDMKSMSSSIGTFVSPGLVVAFVGAAVGYPFLVLRSSRFASRQPALRRLLVAVAALLVAVVWGVAGTKVANGRWSDRSDVLIAKSPHWEFLATYAEELAGGADVPALADDFPRAFLADFRPEPLAGPRLRPAAFTAKGARAPRNVVFLVLESTGARYLSLYGSPYATTPHLDAEAKNALVFDSFYSNVGFTANSLAALSLSVYPYMTWREYTQEYPDYPGETLAQVLNARGYRSALFTNGFLDYVNQDRFLQGRGYETLVDWRGMDAGEPLNSWGGPEGPVLDRALAWIDAEGGRPFHLVFWSQQSHHPYDPDPRQPFVDFFEGKPRPEDDYDLGRFLNTVHNVDRELGRFFAGLRERGLDKDTIVVVTGDHGEAFGEPHETWGHGFKLYQESVQVPLMIWSPALFPKGKRLGTVGGHVDVNPTLTHLLGVAPSHQWEGRSLLAKSRSPRAYFYAANDDYLLGVREDGFKYIFNATRGKEELYDLVADPHEQTNVAAQHHQRCKVLRQRLAAWKHHAGERLAAARGETVVDATPPR